MAPPLCHRIPPHVIPHRCIPTLQHTRLYPLILPHTLPIFLFPSPSLPSAPHTSITRLTPDVSEHDPTPQSHSSITLPPPSSHFSRLFSFLGKTLQLSRPTPPPAKRACLPPSLLPLTPPQAAPPPSHSPHSFPPTSFLSALLSPLSFFTRARISKRPLPLTPPHLSTPFPHLASPLPA